MKLFVKVLKRIEGDPMSKNSQSLEVSLSLDGQTTFSEPVLISNLNKEEFKLCTPGQVLEFSWKDSV